MYSELWNKCHRSICSINIYGSNGAKVRAFTGFKIKDYIVTDDLVYEIKDGKEVEIIFYNEDGVSKNIFVRLQLGDFLVNLPDKKDLENLGFTLIPLRSPEFDEIPPLTLCGSCDNPIGQSIGIIGFQFEHNNLSLKTGIVSSFTTDNNGHSYIQYDGTIKPGNTGAPLIKFENGTVIGIVSNKVLGVVKSFKEMMGIIDSNLEALKQVEGKYKLDSIDIIQVLMVNQNQIKHIAKEFFKNATVRVGYALDIGHLTDYISSKTDIDFDQMQS